MRESNKGLTKTYNRFHDPKERRPRSAGCASCTRRWTGRCWRLMAGPTSTRPAGSTSTGARPRRPTTPRPTRSNASRPAATSSSPPTRPGPSPPSWSAIGKSLPWRYRWRPEVRDDVLARLLLLNKERAEAERRAGLSPLASADPTDEDEDLDHDADEDDDEAADDETMHDVPCIAPLQRRVLTTMTSADVREQARRRPDPGPDRPDRRPVPRRGTARTEPLALVSHRLPRPPRPALGRPPQGRRRGRGGRRRPVRLRRRPARRAHRRTVAIDDSDKAAAVVTGKRQFLPSSMGLSVLVPKATTELEVTVRWGDYHPEYADEKRSPSSDGGVLRRSPRRKPAAEAQEAAGRSSPGPASTRQRRVTLRPRRRLHARPAQTAVPGSNGLSLDWLSRPAPREALDEALVPDGAQTVNVYLVNHREAIHGAAKDRRMAFQAELMVRCEAGFVPRPSLSGLDSDDARRPRGRPPVPRRLRVRRRPQRLGQRRGRRRLHTASSSGRPGSPRPRSSGSSPASWQGITLGMESLGEARDSDDEARAALIGLADQYEAWIAEPAETPHAALRRTRRDLRDASEQRRGRRRADPPGDRGACRTPRPSGPSRWPTRRWPARPAAAIALQQGPAPDDVDEPTWRPVPARVPPAEPPGDRRPGRRRPPDRRPALLPDRRRQDRGLPRPGGLHAALSPVPRRASAGRSRSTPA